MDRRQLIKGFLSFIGGSTVASAAWAKYKSGPMSEITPNVVVSMPSQLFTLAQSFKAAANGRVYVGKIDTNPTIPENQIQVYIYNEDDTAVPVTQPINLNTGGFPIYNGQIAKFLTIEGHSMAVYDAYNVQQFYFPNVLKFEPDQPYYRLREEIPNDFDTPDEQKFVGRCRNIATLRGIVPTSDGQKIDVAAHTSDSDDGGGYFFYDSADTTSVDDNGFTCVVLSNGKRWKRKVLHDLLVEWSGVDTTGTTDVTSELQQMLDISAKFCTTAHGVTTKAILHLNGNIKITGTVSMQAAKVALHGPGTIYVNSKGSYPSGYAFVLTNTVGTPLASYSNKTTPLFRDIMFVSEERTVNLFYGVNKKGDANNNPAALQTVFNCQFKGFGTVYTNGTGGWGWSWYASGCNSCNHWMNITVQPDTYERFSFDSCIFQNGGYVFLLDNPDGKIYWHKGSMDYCEGAAIITRGFIEINSHIEFSARTLPFIEFKGANAHAVVSGLAAIRLNTKTPFNLFKQFAPNQVTMRDIDIISDGVNISSCVFSNMPYLKTNVNLTNEAAKAMALYDTDGSLVVPGVSSVEYVVTGTGLSSVINADGSITLTSSVNSGGSKGLDFFIPITGHTNIGVEWFGSNASVLSPVFVQKLICNQLARSASNNALSTVGLITDHSINGNTSIPIGAVDQRGSSGTMWSIPKSAFYLRLRFNADNIGNGEKFTIHSLKLVSC